MVKVIYFNQWVSSITDVMQDLKQRHTNKIKIIASSKNEDHVYKSAADEFIIEDWEEVKDDIEKTKLNYINWLLETCSKYKVDLFFVKKHAEWIAEYSYKFAINNVILINESETTLKKFNNKSDIYKLLEQHNELKRFIPDYIVVNKLQKDKYIQAIISNLKTGLWCFKLNSDEGGASFRKVDNKSLSMNSLYNFRTNTVTFDEAQQFVNNISEEDLSKLIFMEILDSPEISIDCYNSKQGFIAICRAKENGTRKQRIFYNKELYDVCKSICNILKLDFPFNVQFRVKHDTSGIDNIENLRLLEINPRMSGGVYYATALGMNIANICLCDMLNLTNEYDIKNYIGFETKYVTHTERVVIL